MRVHLRSQASAVEWNKSAGASRAFACANCHRKSAPSSLQRPPVSMATTTKRQRLEVTNSGYAFSLSRRARTMTAPSTSAAPGWGSPVAHKALRKVMSTASCAPPKQGRSWATTSIRLSSPPGTPKFMSRRAALNFTRAPASRHTRARTRSVGPARFLTRPDRVHAARCRPNVSNGSWHPLHVASVTGRGSWRRSNSNTRKRWGGIVYSAVVGAWANATPALRPEWERKWAWQEPGRLVSIEFFLKWESKTEEAQYCQHRVATRLVHESLFAEGDSPHATRSTKVSTRSLCDQTRLLQRAILRGVHPEALRCWVSARRHLPHLECVRWSCAMRLPTTPKMQLVRTARPNATPTLPSSLGGLPTVGSLLLGGRPTRPWLCSKCPHHAQNSTQRNNLVASCPLCGLPSGWRSEAVSAMRTASRAPWGSLPREPFPSPTARPTSPKCTILTRLVFLTPWSRSVATLQDPNLRRFVAESQLCSTLGFYLGVTWSPQPCAELSPANRTRPSLAMDHTRRTNHTGMRTTVHRGEVPLQLPPMRPGCQWHSPCSPPSACVTSRASPPSSNHW